MIDVDPDQQPAVAPHLIDDGLAKGVPVISFWAQEKPLLRVQSDCRSTLRSQRFTPAYRSA